MPNDRMPLASRRRALELGAGFLEHDLDEMRRTARRNQKMAGTTNHAAPVTHSAENDLMKVAEWASAATLLRAMAAEEPS